MEPVMGLKDAKGIIDEFCIFMLKRDAETLAILEKYEIIDLLLHDKTPECMMPYRSTICQKYFGINFISAIKKMRENPVELLIAMAVHKIE